MRMDPILAPAIRITQAMAMSDGRPLTPRCDEIKEVGQLGSLAWRGNRVPLTNFPIKSSHPNRFESFVGPSCPTGPLRSRDG
jgi:hypothetical protein